MSRPTKAEASELDALETLSARLENAEQLCGILSIRLRQMYKRQPGLYDYYIDANTQLTEMFDEIDEARQAVNGILATRQQRRTEANAPKGENDA